MNAIVDLVIANKGTYDVRNVAVTCALYSEADKEIASSSKGLPGVIRPGRWQFQKVDFGPANSKAVTISCWISAFTKAGTGAPTPGEPQQSNEAAIFVQVLSQRSETDAQSAFRALQARYPSLLQTRVPLIRRADTTEGISFIADDLFINFDDKRAAAGFQILNELAKKTQVLFFTHHQHLLDVAKKALGISVPAVTLPAVAAGPEPAPIHSEAAWADSPGRLGSSREVCWACSRILLPKVSDNRPPLTLMPDAR